MSAPILITGATGSVASFVIPQLVAQDLPLRVLSRSPENVEGLRSARIEIAVGDFEDLDSLRKATDGVETVFLVTPAHAKAAQWASNVIDVAESAGVRRVVRLSALKASPDGPTENTRQHAETESQLADSGLDVCILRPHFFMQNVLMALPTMQAEGAMYWGMGDGKLGMIDVRDVADVAARALSDPAFDGATLELTGPESISFHDAAERLTGVLGEAIRYVPISPEAVASHIEQAGMGAWFARLMRDYSAAYAEGWGDYTTGEVERVAGHEPRTFATFAEDVLRPAFKLARI